MAKQVVVASTSGVRFNLGKRKIIEIGVNPYFLNRVDLRKAIKKDADSVKYKIRYSSDGSISDPIPAGLFVSKKNGKVTLINIGCKSFTRKNARTLYRWALRKSR